MVDLRFFADLVSCELFIPKDGLPLLDTFLNNVIACDEEDHHNAIIILAFCQYCGLDYAGLVSQKLTRGADNFGLTIPTSDWLPLDDKLKYRRILLDYYSSFCNHITKVFTFRTLILCHYVG